MKKKNYKLRQFKNFACKRYPYHGTPLPGSVVGEAPDGCVVPILAIWMVLYFPFRGVVQSRTSKSVDVKIHGASFSLVKEK